MLAEPDAPEDEETIEAEWTHPAPPPVELAPSIADAPAFAEPLPLAWRVKKEQHLELRELARKRSEQLLSDRLSLVPESPSGSDTSREQSPRQQRVKGQRTSLAGQVVGPYGETLSQPPLSARRAARGRSMVRWTPRPPPPKPVVQSADRDRHEPVQPRSRPAKTRPLAVAEPQAFAFPRRTIPPPEQTVARLMPQANGRSDTPGDTLGAGPTVRQRPNLIKPPFTPTTGRPPVCWRQPISWRRRSPRATGKRADGATNGATATGYAPRPPSPRAGRAASARAVRDPSDASWGVADYGSGGSLAPAAPTAKRRPHSATAMTDANAQAAPPWRKTPTSSASVQADDSLPTSGQHQSTSGAARGGDAISRALGDIQVSAISQREDCLQSITTQLQIIRRVRGHAGRLSGRIMELFQWRMAKLLVELRHTTLRVVEAAEAWRQGSAGTGLRLVRAEGELRSVPEPMVYQGDNYLLKVLTDLCWLPLPGASDPFLLRWFGREAHWWRAGYGKIYPPSSLQDGSRLGAPSPFPLDLLAPPPIGEVRPDPSTPGAPHAPARRTPCAPLARSPRPLCRHHDCGAPNPGVERDPHGDGEGGGATQGRGERV